MRIVFARIVSALTLTLALAAASASAAVRDYRYLSPLPGSRMVAPENNVTIRLGDAIDAASVTPDAVSVTGSRSGAHGGQLRLAADGRTLVFRPDAPFATRETVRVHLRNALRTHGGDALPPLDYTFQVSAVRSREMPTPAPEFVPPPAEASAWWNEPAPSLTTAGACDPTLPGFPAFSLVNVNNQQSGVFFLAPFANSNTTVARLQILDDRGQALFQRQFNGVFRPTDFKVQPDGRLTFFLSGAEKFYVMDGAYAVVDSFECGNGYPTDLHELSILPDGHALLMSYDPQPVDMSQVVAGGNPNAIVIGLVVQELDENKDVVFQWRSWDYFQITDAAPANNINLTGSIIDYCHGNSIAKSPDGNLVISSRHMNEITKIDRQTGGILWRMGRNAIHNEWSFPNDTRGFSEQHDARILPNGNLTLFDNGNFLSPQYSRALEFQLDEVNKVATKVWEYRSTPDIFGGFMGNVQRHDDGSTTIGWGGSAGTTKTTDLHPDGTVAAEIQGPGTQVNYRGFRLPWRSNRFMTSVEALAVASPAVGVPASQSLKLWNHWNQAVDITCLRTGDAAFSAEPLSGSLPLHLEPGDTTTVIVTYTPSDGSPLSSRLYAMQVNDTVLVAQPVDLEGHVGGTLDVPPGTSVALSATAHPNPMRVATTIDYVVPSAGHVTLELFDVHGRKVATLVDGERSAGRHSVEWTAARGRGGLYFYRLRAAGRAVVEKLVVAGQ